MEKSMIILSLMFAWGLTASADSIVCAAKGLTVSVSDNHKFLTLKSAKGENSYPVTGITTRTGDVDWTYHTNAGLQLTLDDQYGDSVTINNRAIKVKCSGR